MPVRMAMRGFVHCCDGFFFVFFLWRFQQDKDTRSDTEAEDTNSEDESIVERKTCNNDVTANGERHSHEINANNTSSQNKKTR